MLSLPYIHFIPTDGINMIPFLELGMCSTVIYRKKPLSAKILKLTQSQSMFLFLSKPGNNVCLNPLSAVEQSVTIARSVQSQTHKVMLPYQLFRQILQCSFILATQNLTNHGILPPGRVARSVASCGYRYCSVSLLINRCHHSMSSWRVLLPPKH